MFSKPATLTLIALLFLSVSLAPLLALLVSSLNVDGAFGLDRYQYLWSSPKPRQLFGHSLLLAGLTTLTATGLGVPLGILFGKTDLPWRYPLLVLFTLPLLLPSYFLSIGWFSLLGREAKHMGAGLGGGSGWVMLGYNLHSGLLENYWQWDHLHAPSATLPIGHGHV